MLKTKQARISLLLTVVFGFIAHNLYFIYGYTNPDGIIEGLTNYINATWAITGCGRWFLPILTYLSGNVIMPFVSVLGYCICVWLSSILISKLFKQESSLFTILCPIIMIVAPAVVIHFNYNVVSFPYALAMLLSTIYAYSIFELKKVFKYIIAIVCITCSLGIYQNYIGYAACLVLITVIVKLLNGTKIKDLVNDILSAFITAIVGSALYLLALKIILVIFNLDVNSRMSSISLTNIFSNLTATYNNYFAYFNDAILFRKYIYAALALMFIIILITNIFKQDILNTIIISICILLIPLASNIALLIIENQEVTTCMSYQYMLIVIFVLSLALKTNNIIKYLTVILCTILTWTHIVSANATYRCYKLSYDHINNQMSQIVYDIQHHQDYIKDETPVIIVGFVDDDTLRNNIDTYKYAIDLPENVAFWKQSTGITYNRQKYFMNYFGLDFKDINFDDYKQIVDSKDYKTMQNWPNSASIKKIGKFLVVKISDEIVE